jgi:hypothetical protein
MWYGGAAEGEQLGRGCKGGVKQFGFPGSSFQEVSVFRDSEDTNSAVSPQPLGGFRSNLNRPCRLRSGMRG